MSHGKQFTLFTHVFGPNGWKVTFVLEELGLSYESKYLDFGKQEQKSAEYTQYNPNGRIPALIDHGNNDFVVWESNAIMLYLVEKYDTAHRISAVTADERAHQLQWLFFQASGQGPYYGQAGWFVNWHPEKFAMYTNEVLRVLGVLEGVLSKRDWLVGGKYTIADISFVPYVSSRDEKTNPEINFERDFPAVLRWHNAIISREPIAQQIELRESLL
ncbi:thioredoxin-like protein [Fomitopsis betulina]|nr:thioredoxin-like protein [Fomitopsis betulina]